MVEAIKTTGTIVSAVLSIITLLTLLVKPLREAVFKSGKKDDGAKALLRDRITQIYYENLDDKSLDEYQYENLGYLYTAYKARGGNSFVDKIYSEMENEWSVRRR